MLTHAKFTLSVTLLGNMRNKGLIKLSHFFPYDLRLDVITYIIAYKDDGQTWDQWGMVEHCPLSYQACEPGVAAQEFS